MSQHDRDIAILRDLAQQMMATAALPKYAERIQLWTEHNSLQRTRPLVLVCCEDLTRKMEMLRQLKNLRRIAVTPWADVTACARQIEDKYVLSWRPNPAPMVCSGFDPEWITKAMREGLTACAGCHTDILLKDIQTVQGKPERLKNWARLAKDIAEEDMQTI